MTLTAKQVTHVVKAADELADAALSGKCAAALVVTLLPDGTYHYALHGQVEPQEIMELIERVKLRIHAKFCAGHG